MAARDSLAVQLAARPTQRAPLLGAATPGLAFDHYAVATTAAAPLDRDRNAEARKLLTADDATVAAAPAKRKPRARPTTPSALILPRPELHALNTTVAPPIVRSAQNRTCRRLNSCP